jgi:hypothetical protein
MRASENVSDNGNAHESLKAGYLRAAQALEGPEIQEVGAIPPLGHALEAPKNVIKEYCTNCRSEIFTEKFSRWILNQAMKQVQAMVQDDKMGNDYSSCKSRRFLWHFEPYFKYDNEYFGWQGVPAMPN